MTIACEECGRSTNGAHRFCPWCGELLDDIRELVSQAVYRPSMLYHYTSAEAAAKIVESGRLWATEISHLNDASEFLHGRQVAREVVTARLVEWADLVEFKDTVDLLQRVAAGLASTAVPKIFVSAFSSLGDSRSQWGLYCKGLGGVALGFDHEKLRRLTPQGYPYPSAPPERIRQTPLQVFPCVYRPRTQQKLIWHQLDMIQFEEVPEIDEARREGKLNSAAAGLVRSCTGLAAALKNPCFADEREWRLVGGKPADALVHSLIRSGSPVFYLELDLAAGSEAFPIVELVVGPQRDQDAAASRWRIWLDQRGLQAVTVTKSLVPLRAV